MGQPSACGADDLFGLDDVPINPTPNYRRLSRYDKMGLIWLLRGRPVVALTRAAAAITNPTGAILMYHRNNTPLFVTGNSDDLLRSAGRQ